MSEHAPIRRQAIDQARVSLAHRLLTQTEAAMLLDSIDILEESLDGLRSDQEKTRENMRVLIDDAQRWQNAYNRARDELAAACTDNPEACLAVEVVREPHGRRH